MNIMEDGRHPDGGLAPNHLIPQPYRRMTMNETFEPQILAYCCKYCAYAAADLAGSMRLNYPSNVKIIQVPCSGRVDILHLLTAFERGADGVYVAG